MSSIKQSRTADEIQRLIQERTENMEVSQSNSDYVSAEKCRIEIQELKKQHEARRVYEMNQRHHQEANDLQKAHQNEINEFNNLWDKKMGDYEKQSERLLKEMDGRHTSQIQKTEKDLDQQLSYKVKESSQCLNLRKMEEHMVKQKNYVEAHKVQAKVKELEQGEKQIWMTNRNQKIGTAINTLKTKQATQLTNLQKKIKSGIDENNKERHFQEKRINKKYENLEKDLKSTQDKEVLAYKGSFRSKGGQGSPLLTKSKIQMK